MLFQNLRTVFICSCLIFLLQAVYYVLNFQLKKTSIPIFYFPEVFTYPQSSDHLFTQTSSVTSTIQHEIHAFPDASISTTKNFTQPESSIYTSFPLCQLNLTKNDSSYRVTVEKKIVPFYVIEKQHADDLHVGGHWFPSSCQPEQRLAIIVCYRNREMHLRLFLNNLHSFLKKQMLDYTIFVVNQHGNELFNRAALFNVGVLEALKLYSFNCFIFHDVDLIPEDLRNIYRCGEKPRHMSVAVDKFNYRLFYSTLFGGVTAFSLPDFLGANGYPNVYWGWGGEDDDMYLRVTKKLKKTITRYPMDIARYKMIRSYNHTSGQVNPFRHLILESKYDYSLDGINTTNYQLHQIVFYRLFTLINVTLHQENFEQIRRRLNIKIHEKKKATVISRKTKQ